MARTMSMDSDVTELMLDKRTEGDDEAVEAATAGRRFYAKVFVFVVFTQVVQALMSYDGGATQFCQVQLAKFGWTASELGLLGAMDKFGQVATAAAWGRILERRDAWQCLAIGLFWKAACCVLFGYLQQQSMDWTNKIFMLTVKLGMGITEALVSVWATVWVTRNAPANARARWLGLAGTSAGVGSGIGSGVASLWDPASAFLVQGAFLMVIWVVLLLTPSHLFKSGVIDVEAEEEEDETSSAIANPNQMLFQQVSRAMSLKSVSIVAIESLRHPGHFLDATHDPFPSGNAGFKVRLTQGDPQSDWALFKLVKHGQSATLESVRLPGHFFVSEKQGFRFLSGLQASVSEVDVSCRWAQLKIHHVFRAGESAAVQFESASRVGHFVDASGERLMRAAASSYKLRFTQGSPSKADDWSLFRLHPMKAPSAQAKSQVTPAQVQGNLAAMMANRLWLWTAMSISMSCFVTSGVAYLWQNTVHNVWGVSSQWSFGLFFFSTGIGGLVGVALGPKVFDGKLGGFKSSAGQQLCLLWCKRAMCIAAVCSTVCAFFLGEAAIMMVRYNRPFFVDWHLVTLLLCVFAVFALINGIQGTLYGINTMSAGPEMQAYAAGLTVAFQNVFGYASGPLLPGLFAHFIGSTVKYLWPMFEWNRHAVAGAQYASGMGLALIATWTLFWLTRHANIRARLNQVAGRL